jgi:hypothetical protein
MVDCEHLTDKGCGIYEDRFPVCRKFKCCWLEDPIGFFKESDRPDQLGAYLESSQDIETTPSGRKFKFFGVFAKNRKVVRKKRMKKIVKSLVSMGCVVALKVPPVTIEVHAPEGFQVRWLDEDGFKFVVFDPGYDPADSVEKVPGKSWYRAKADVVEHRVG